MNATKPKETYMIIGACRADFLGTPFISRNQLLTTNHLHKNDFLR